MANTIGPADQLTRHPETGETSTPPPERNDDTKSTTGADGSTKTRPDVEAHAVLQHDRTETDSNDLSPLKTSFSRDQLSHSATVLIVVAMVALASLAGSLTISAYHSRHDQRQGQQFLQTGRQAALNLTTIDWQQADTDIQRIINSATGKFYDDFSTRAQPLIDVVKQVRSKSVGTVTEAGIESETETAAQILVAVSVKTTTAEAPEQGPKAWRMRIAVQKVGHDTKIANVEFVP
ncbi:hypothetical protein [Mycolicibacter algericus]|uniref:Mce associated membrane protein n=2 Tax=Mycolicibacter algericus TaxID=1288388 RepID=A0A7I9YH56_MYCAL|nr:hypothetical protein [Mycolicibacter algericus]OQZ92584.1 hypothetical protein BST10_21050 [Mycolicibacter algericus DSM 45454]GFG85622.1 hypothetical protein MALGJ_22980 [Mycolicibacter algericus]GFG87939.1 hypothetical protein MALGJ_46150 [Mycolicibacter algericus]